MKNKLRFIMPRLAGATVVTGLAALVITTLFKLLLCLTLLAGGIALLARSFGRRRQQLGQYEHDAMPGLGNRNAFDNSRQWNSPIQPVNGYATQKGTSIVPID